jgi:hypothetical protein
MCVQCMMGVTAAATGATGLRAWLAAKRFTWMSPRRMHLATVSLVVAALIGASVGVSGT